MKTLVPLTFLLLLTFGSWAQKFPHILNADQVILVKEKYVKPHPCFFEEIEIGRCKTLQELIDALQGHFYDCQIFFLYPPELIDLYHNLDMRKTKGTPMEIFADAIRDTNVQFQIFDSHTIAIFRKKTINY